MLAGSRHQCVIYDGSPAAYLQNLAAALHEKLRNSHRCLYMNSPAMVAGLRSCLAANGLDVTAEVRKGSLVLSSDQSHLVNGNFDAGNMLGLLEQALDQALNEGYSGLWATGDMTWEFGNEKNFVKLLDYEYGLEELFQKCPALSGICQYHAAALPPGALQQALCTHRTVFINQTLSLMNPYYEPSDTFARQQRPASAVELNTMLRQFRQAAD